MDLLKGLAEAPGAPGREERLRALIHVEVSGGCDRIDEDAMGNLICFRKATPSSPSGGDTLPKRVMVACHMDEIGVYVRKVMDSCNFSDRGLVDRCNEFAQKHATPYQLESLPLGGTGAAAVQKSKFGCKAVTLSVPTRYIQAVSETIAKAALFATRRLLEAFVEAGRVRLEAPTSSLPLRIRCGLPAQHQART
ncbi:MAG: hypothetical protein AUK47_10165 [Deltaproteobacteria bacterium CG2_30_63_29]|nr:MAG: hypothetical protein AUK47_10165 [Deltaproteobacteria bacterium CG2_30_63_29]PJB42463.1 MAG: hypothetical protein CO108_11555 [Deltaproteobacteria bacterium CG_4_9_14_3_um_filter_63_12]